MIWTVLKTLLARLLDSPDALRKLLGGFLDQLKAAAVATATTIDDIACQVADTLLADDDLWEEFVAWYMSILNGGILVGGAEGDIAETLRSDSGTIVLAQRLSAVTGISFSDIMELLLALAPILIDWWKNRNS